MGFLEYFTPEINQQQNAPSTARRKSKVKSQKSKVLRNKLFRVFKWLLYLRRVVLAIMAKLY